MCRWEAKAIHHLQLIKLRWPSMSKIMTQTQAKDALKTIRCTTSQLLMFHSKTMLNSTDHRNTWEDNRERQRTYLEVLRPTSIESPCPGKEWSDKKETSEENLVKDLHHNQESWLASRRRLNTKDKCVNSNRNSTSLKILKECQFFRRNILKQNISATLELLNKHFKRHWALSKTASLTRCWTLRRHIWISIRS